MQKKLILVVVFLFLSSLASMATPQKDINIFGYFSVNLENVWEAPLGVDASGKTTYENTPAEYSYPHFDLMLLSTPTDRIKIFVDIGYMDKDALELVNYFGEYSFSDALYVSAGKRLRQFGLFNEILQAVPTYLGIEPPELFDKDHLMLPRNTTFMIGGNLVKDKSSFRYSLDTSQGESVNGNIPLGWDFRWEYKNIFTLGHSGYYSAEKSSTRNIGEGSPRGGIKPWMDHDTYFLYGAFTQLELTKITLKAAFWISNHDAIRDPAKIVILAKNAGLNSSQMERFGLGDYNPGDDVPQSAVITDINYDVITFYIRFGYKIDLPKNYGELTPFIFWDYYKNPESIASKTYGGDGEAGLTDNGSFHKPTIGFVYRPNIHWAIKFDASSHLFTLNGKNEHYEEVRFDVSFFFGAI
jgi:hypothetical protein